MRYAGSFRCGLREKSGERTPHPRDDGGLREKCQKERHRCDQRRRRWCGTPAGDGCITYKRPGDRHTDRVQSAAGYGFFIIHRADAGRDSSRHDGDREGGQQKCGDSGRTHAGSELPGNQVRRDEFLCCVHASSASICLYTLQSSPSPIFVTRPASYWSSTQFLRMWTISSVFATGRPSFCVSQTAMPAAPELREMPTRGGLLSILRVSKMLYISSSFNRPSAWMPAW